MDDIKLFAKNEKELEILIQTVTIYSQDIKMEFGIGKCAVLVMKSGKRQMAEGVKLPNQEKLRSHGESETYKYIGILEADTIKLMKMKEKFFKRPRRHRKVLETKLNCRNLIVRYSGPFLKWTKEELKQMDQNTKKLMRIHKALHPRDDVARLYVSRKEEGRSFGCTENSVDTSIQLLEEYIAKRRGRLIRSTRKNTDNTRIS